MYQLDSDTICAISTPSGVGGIAVVRVSGPDAISIVDKIWRGRPLAEVKSHTAHLGDIVDPDRSEEPLDSALATVFRAPRSFTGENVVEISVHGSRWIQRELVNLLIRSGCRMAEAGEFTRRAFANGRLDLAQAEAVADVIASSSRSAHRLASSQMRGDFSKQIGHLRDELIEIASLLELELDFSEEDVEFASRARLRELAEGLFTRISALASSFSTGSALKDGVSVAIVGEPNVGKSTLLNLLLHDNRAIVSDIPGTTRDTIEDTMEIDGVLYRFIDTAGIRDTADSIESLGIERSYAAIGRARIVVWLVAPDMPAEHYEAMKQAILEHKSDEATLITAITKIDTLPSSGKNSDNSTQAPNSPSENFPADSQYNDTCLRAEAHDKNHECTAPIASSDSQTGSAFNDSTVNPNSTNSDNAVNANGIGSAIFVDTSVKCCDNDMYSNGADTTLVNTSRIDSDNDINATGKYCDNDKIKSGKCCDKDKSASGIWKDDSLLKISATTGENIPLFLETLHHHSGADQAEEADLIVTNGRHYEALTHAKDSISRVISGLDANISGDFIAQDLRETIHHLSTITGTITTTDLLSTIFSKFCIGK